MSESTNIDLSAQQLDIIKRGLRYVKRAVSLDMYDPTDKSVAQRENDLSEIEKLAGIVESFVPTKSTVNA